MNRKMLSDKNVKTICSVTDLVGMLGLSRARFYQLLKEGIFPQPVYDIRTRRPFFTAQLQEHCLRIRQTGIGFNGCYILFYARRNNNGHRKEKNRNRSNSKYSDLTATLTQMGLDVSVSQVKDAIEALYPEGLEEQNDEGTVIRDLFRYLKGIA